MINNDTHLDYYAFLRDYAATSELVGALEGEEHFFRGDADEFYVGLRNRCVFPCVVGEGFSNTYERKENGIVKYRGTAFAVLDSYNDKDNYDQIDAAVSRSEIIGDDILRRLIALCKEKNCLLEIDDVECRRFENRDDRFAGLRYDVVISSLWQP